MIDPDRKGMLPPNARLFLLRMFQMEGYAYAAAEAAADCYLGPLEALLDGDVDPLGGYLADVCAGSKP